MNLKRAYILAMLILSCGSALADWAGTARIVGFSPKSADEDINQAIDWAVSANASVVVVRQRVVSELNWLDKINKGDSLALDVLNRTIKICHRKGLRAVVDLSVLQLRSFNADRDLDGKLDSGVPTVLTEHSGWIQEDINGKKAVFYGNLTPESNNKDETVWATFSHAKFKTKLLDLVRAVSALNPDGILFSNLEYAVDVKGWENSWASFDAQTKSLYTKTLPAKEALGDLGSSHFTNWALWRMNQLTKFSEELHLAVKNKNPETKTFMLLKNALSNETLARGYDLVKLSAIFDGFVHDIKFADDAVSRNSYEWMFYFAALKTANELDGNKPSWVIDWPDSSSSLAVSKDMNKLPNAVATGMYSALQAGLNVWITGGSQKYNAAANLSKTAEIFNWVKENQNWLYGDRAATQSVGVYFSPATLLYRTGNTWEGHLAALYGTLMMLHEMHIPTTLIHPSNLAAVGKNEIEAIVLPQVDCASGTEIDSLREYYDKSNLIVYFSGNDDNHCDENGKSAAFSWDSEMLEAMQRGGEKKGEAFFHNAALNGSGNPLNISFPAMEAENIKTDFSADLNYAAQTSYSSFEMPNSTVVRAVKTSEAAFYHVINFGGLDSGSTARTIGEEVNIYRNGEELESGAIELNGGSLELMSYYSEVNSEQTLNLVENSMGSSAIIRAGVLPELEEDIVSNRPYAESGKAPQFNLSKRFLLAGRSMRILYKHASDNIQNMDFYVFDTRGNNVTRLPLKKSGDNFYANWDINGDGYSGMAPGVYAYKLTGNGRALKMGQMVVR